MKRSLCRSFSVLLVALFVSLLASTSVRAQFYGSVGIGGEATNNVQSLDTTAPDQLLMPAIELNYDVQPAAVSKITLSAGYTPNFYSVNPALSYNFTTIGATGLFYLTHQDDIAAESADASENVRLPNHSHFISPVFRAAESYTIFRPAPPKVQQQNNDSLVDLATSALYTLSGELDSTDISTKGLSKSRVSQAEDLRDSISDVISTIADLLDSVGYSESTAEIVRGELEHLRAPLAKLMPLTKPSHTDPTLLDAAIDALTKAKPESDFLTTTTSPTTTPTERQNILTQLTQPLAIGGNTAEETETPNAPNLTLVSSSTRLRDFGYGDVFVREDLDDSNATTLATVFTIPLTYASHRATQFASSDTTLFGGSVAGNPNDYHTLTLGVALEGFTSSNFSLRGSYDFSRSVFPFDSVYSNTENRFRLNFRTGFGNTAIIGEGSLGLRDYLNPFQVTGPHGKVLRAATSKFSQYTFGIGLSQFIGSRWVIGGLINFNNSPNLQAYITTGFLSANGKKIRPAVQIADDEFTYNLSRYTLFSNVRVWLDFDLGADLSFEHRVYGSAINKNGQTILGGEGRIEDGQYLNISISKIFAFEDRLLSVFTGVMPTLQIQNASVDANQQTYSYHSTNVDLSLSLLF